MYTYCTCLAGEVGLVLCMLHLEYYRAVHGIHSRVQKMPGVTLRLVQAGAPWIAACGVRVRARLALEAPGRCGNTIDR